MQTQSGRLPDFLIVGAAKSATTSLYAYLCQHPAVFMPLVKEFHFFSYAGTEWQHTLYAKNLFQYANFFRKAPEQCLLGEASTTYLYEYARTIERIKSIYGADAEKIRIIISLRDPAERAFSHYSMYRLYGLEKWGFDEAVREGAAERLNANLDSERFGITLDYLRAGMYAEQVRAYMDAFPHVHIVLYDDIRRDPQAVMRGIFRFLDVDERQAVSCDVVHNSSGIPRSGIVHAALNAANKFIVTRQSRLKAALLRCISWFVDWDAVRTRAGAAALRILAGIRFMNAKKASLLPAARKRMVDYYRADIARLERLIGRDLSAWLA